MLVQWFGIATTPVDNESRGSAFARTGSTPCSEQSASIEHVDVLIVGAGIPRRAARVLPKDNAAGRTFAIVEARYQQFSQTPMHTFSYEFQRNCGWHEKAYQRGRHHGRDSLAGGDRLLTPANTCTMSSGGHRQRARPRSRWCQILLTGAVTMPK